ncbi:MAG: gliding motility-associated C-terminal domain-containing protein [Bacteroidales bacterium]|jgi:gliding motility-associated-like protein|nr:gliding motility-associated C-terminal domain-containing protein [Bacteroidales bacterium]
MQQRCLVVFILMSLAFSGFATHERAGEITYRHISGRTYEFTITTYVYTASPAKREYLDIDWGDGSSKETVPRISETFITNDITRNIYIATHTFNSNGTYTVSMEDPNRNADIINIPRSIEVPFYIETVIVINATFGGNSSPVLTNPPVDNGCVGAIFYHNPAAVDAEGDSLVYSLINCKGIDGVDIPGYTLPLANSITIDRNSGDFVWDAPRAQGEYNIAILIEEYRSGIKIGSIIRDMQINIASCDNQPPLLDLQVDTCITAGDSIAFTVTARDDTAQLITLTAKGDVLSCQSPAKFPSSTTAKGQVSGLFSWQTNCSHIRKQPYHLTLKAEDNGFPVHLSIVKTFSIKVLAPPVENVLATPLGNSITVTWDTAICLDNAKGYKIYRREDSSGYILENCITGVPPQTGYQMIGIVSIATHSFTDNNSGKGLRHGVNYCYVVIVYYGDGSESYMSNEACTVLKNEIPMITKVSIDKTDPLTGVVQTAWEAPTDLDSTQYPPPYQYQIERSINDSLHFSTIAVLGGNARQYIDSLQNTQDNIFYYRVNLRLLADTSVALYSDAASSPFLQIESSDCQLIMNWKVETIWKNYQYIIYRYNPLTSLYDSIGSTENQEFIDTGLTNGVNYCYYIKTVGEYGDTSLPHPLLNLSQIVCQTPIDNMPPCPPQLSGDGNCSQVALKWSYSIDCRQADIDKVYIWYKPEYKGEYTLIDSVKYPTDNYLSINDLMVVGCFKIIAIDTNGNIGQSSEELCFEPDCNHYRLPNVFTPNGDGINDLFEPFPYTNIEQIEINIYNRWGEKMFYTQNPDIQWDGVNMMTHQPCSDGVYFYVCAVEEKTLNGLKKKYLTGSITILR